MLRVKLKTDVDELNPPSSMLAVMSARAVERRPNPSPHGPAEWGGGLEVEVSVEQLREMLRLLWRLLPAEERPCP